MGLIYFAAYLIAGLAMLASFTWLYLRVTPYNEAVDISNGNMAPAVALSGAMLGITFPLLVASFMHADLGGLLAWGIVACVAQLAVFWLLHRLLPAVIETNNGAGATCFAAASVFAGLINGASFIP